MGYCLWTVSIKATIFSGKTSRGMACVGATIYPPSEPMVGLVTMETALRLRAVAPGNA